MRFLPLLLLAYFSIISTVQSFPKTSDGWSIFTPSEDSLILYVSNNGNDETGRIYTKNELDDSPFTPPKNKALKPFKTFAAAFKRTRKNKPDWILVKRGDTFFESIKVRNGKNLSEPFLVAAYGENNTNPIFNTGEQRAIDICCNSFSFIAIQGLDFYAHTRIPNSEHYTSPKGSYGLNVYINKNKLGNGFLLEGNRFNYYTSNVIQGPGKLKNVLIRRNSFLDNYSTTTHSQGLYASNIGLTLEENIFLHNGWLIKANKTKKIDKKQGAATMFNHNTYFSDTHDVKFIKNIFINPASMHNKWTANKGIGSSSNVLIKNNLYIDGEIGISAGGNKVGPYRFKNYRIVDNVMLNIGRSQPTNRALGWGVEIKDWDGGTVKNNYFLNQLSPAVTNSYGINISGQNQNITIENNTVNNLFNSNALVLTGNKNKNITITNNKLSLPKSSKALVKAPKDLIGYSFEKNQYYHEAGQSKTYTSNIEKSSLWQRLFASNSHNFTDWIDLTNEHSNQWNQFKIIEQRTIESYLESIHEEPTIDNFIREVRNMSFTNWNPKFTAKKVNKYIKAGYKQNEYANE